ncbi:MAG: hypothetical protein Q8L23_11995 [Caulobacter sp.]|nr:hypothetical protein [Caulobacter sp.]
MDTPFLTVADTFAITGRGLVVVPGPLESEYDGPRQFAVRLKLPNGEQLRAELTLERVFQTPPPKEYRYACLLRGVAKSDVPVGTEIYLGTG